MDDDFMPVSARANGAPCDFCDQPAAGWVRCRFRNRSLGGLRGIQTFMWVDTLSSANLPGADDPNGFK